MTPRTISATAFSMLAALAVACSGSTSDPTSGAEPELGTGPALASGDFPLVERAGDQLPPFGCRHYQVLHVGAARGAPHALLEPKLDSADPADMDPDGSCGGEELPKNSQSDYPVKLVERTSCGAAVYEGTIKWTDSGKVTRTMRLTDYRIGNCTTRPARLVAEVTSTYQGQTNKIGTFYSVDPR
jgi:hypothetical protein